MSARVLKRNPNRTIDGFKLLILISLEILMAFSNIGYIVVPPISVTLMSLPLLVGALCFGPVESMVIGGIFGLTSMWKATASAIYYGDIVFSPIHSGQPVESLILSVGTRIFYGLAAWFLYWLVFRYMKHKKTGLIIATFLATRVHSVCVLGAMQTFFPDTGASVWKAFTELGQVGNILTIMVDCIAVIAIYILSQKSSIQEFQKELSAIQYKENKKRYYLYVAGILGASVLIGISLVQHYLNRTMLLIGRYGIVMPDDFQTRFAQIGAQFMVSMVALGCLMSVLFIAIGGYTSEMQKKASRDLMTGLYNKEVIMRGVNHVLKDAKEADKGYFLILDIDDFKLINDTFGHPFGDRVLIDIAQILKADFTESDRVGRLGGDEFGVYIRSGDKDNIMGRIKAVCEDIAALEYQIPARVTCSIGLADCNRRGDFAQVYSQADKALYLSKQNGKNQFTLYEE